MPRRPSLRSIVTTLAAAVVLVGGASLASYAATGHPLVLGHANKAVGTTFAQERRAGYRAPASTRRSRCHRWWSTAASSSSTSTRTRSTGSRRASRRRSTYQIRVAATNSTWTDQRFVTSSVQPGVFRSPSPASWCPTPATGLTCLVGDKRFFTGTPTDFRASSLGARLPADRADERRDHQRRRNRHGDQAFHDRRRLPRYGSDLEGLLAVAVNLTRVNGISSRHTQPFSPARSATRALPGH